MHPQLRPMMQPPMAGRTGKAPPPPVGPPGAGGGAGVSPDIAFVAVLAGASVLAPAPTTAAPNPTITTNRTALARLATLELPTFVITLNFRRRTPDAQCKDTCLSARRHAPGARASADSRC